MSIYDVTAQIIADANLGVPGKDLFVFHGPDSVKHYILIIESLDGVELDENLPGYKKASFKIIVRNPDYQSALTIAKQVMAVVDLHRRNVDGISIKRMRVTHDPIVFPIPDSDVIEASINVWAAFVEP